MVGGGQSRSSTLSVGSSAGSPVRPCRSEQALRAAGVCMCLCVCVCVCLCACVCVCVRVCVRALSTDSATCVCVCVCVSVCERASLHSPSPGAAGGPRGCYVLIFERARLLVKLPGRRFLPHSPDLRPSPPFGRARASLLAPHEKKVRDGGPAPGLHPVIRVFHNMENYEEIPPPRDHQAFGYVSIWDFFCANAQKQTLFPQ